jgi:hypothetical protein
MRFDYISISRDVAEKILRKHGVSPDEARQAVEQGRVFRGPNSRQGGRTYIVRGRTYAGRRLWLLVRPSTPRVAKLITARDDE